MAANCNLARVVQVIFNQAKFSDLKLIVDETPFYCCRDIMIPISQYLERFAQWPLKNPVGSAECENSISTVSIDLPKIEIPDGSSQTEPRIDAFRFEIFLKVIYGLHSLSTDNLEELFSVIQIAEFMISPSVSATCDDLLCSVSFDEKHLLSMALFCQKYSQTNTLQGLRKRLSRRIKEYVCNPQLYKLDPEQFADIVKNGDRITLLLWISACYASCQIPKSDDFPRRFHIKDPERVEWFKDVARCVIRGWTLERTDTEMRNLQRFTIIFDSEQSADAFLYRAIAERYHELRKSAKAK